MTLQDGRDWELCLEIDPLCQNCHCNIPAFIFLEQGRSSLSGSWFPSCPPALGPRDHHRKGLCLAGPLALQLALSHSDLGGLLLGTLKTCTVVFCL